MGNKDTYVQFNPDNRVFWASHAGLPAMDDKELDAMYQRAHKFFIERINKLIKEHKWRELEVANRQIFLSLSGDGYINRFSVPKTFFSFLGPNQFADWRMQFEMGVFEAKRPSAFDNDFFISGPSSLSDIFYLFQSIAPGMLVIAGRNGEADDMGEMEWVRALPRWSWIIENAQMLKYVFGSTNAYEALLEASQDKERSFAVSWVSPWDDDASDCRSTGSGYNDDDWDDEEEYEWPAQKPQTLNPATWTPACGSECGGCSQCDL